MARDFEVTNPEYLRALEKIRKAPFNKEYLNSLRKEEEEKFKGGRCPECGSKLYRHAQSFFRGQMDYSLPTCEECKKEFCFLFVDNEEIPAKGEKEFWELMHKSMTI